VNWIAYSITNRDVLFSEKPRSIKSQIDQIFDNKNFLAAD